MMPRNGKIIALGIAAAFLLLVAGGQGAAGTRTEAEDAYNLGIKYYSGIDGVEKDIPRAVGWFRKSAELGSAKGQYRLGAACQKGEGTKQDYAEALKWYRRSALQNDRDGESGLGDLYAGGFSVKKDYVEAVKWYFKAAEQGEAHAQYQLGMQYLAGYGVGQNYAEAYFWLALAAKEIDAAVDERDEVASHLTADQLRAVQNHVEQWKPAVIRATGTRHGL